MVVILLGGEHVHELAAAVTEVAKFQGFLGQQGAHDGGDNLAEVGEDGGVNLVGLGELPGALGEVADLTGVNDDGGQAGGEQGADGGLLIRAGGFQHDALGREGLGPSDELFNAGGRIVEAVFDPGGSGMGVEEIFADIDANPDAAHGRDSRITRRSNEGRRRSCSSW